MLTQVTNPQTVFYVPQRLVVPLFQRPYVWSKDAQWEPLWNDVRRLVERIEAGDNAATHFLGAVVLQNQPVPIGAMAQHTVIDGQQRITTLQIFLRALHTQLVELGRDGPSEQVAKLIMNDASYRRVPEDAFKLWPTNRDRAAFAAVMSGEPNPIAAQDQPRFEEAYAYFTAAIRDWLEGDPSLTSARADLLVPVVTTRLQLVSIQLEATEDAQEIFETLNARGTPLTAADLIKNFIFQRIDADPAQIESAYLRHWSQFETPFWEKEVSSGRIRHSRSSLFLTQWLTARTLEDVPAREVFARFKAFVQLQSEPAEVLLEALHNSAMRYEAFTAASEIVDGPLDRLAMFVYRVSTLDSELAKPLLIWLGEPDQAAIEGHDREAFLAVLESWFVRRALVRVPSQGANRFIIDLLVQLRKRGDRSLTEAATTFLANQPTTTGCWPDDAEVRRELSRLHAYKRLRRGRLRMLLEAVEDAMRGGRSLGPIVRGTATIEHILPQEWRANWRELDSDENSRDDLVHTLGNLTLVTRALNSRLSNAAWLGASGKREALAEHDTLLLTRRVVRDGGERWTDAHIVDRTEELIEAILEIWPVPEGHRSQVSTSSERTQYTTSVLDLIRVGLLEAGVTLHARPQANRGRTAVVGDDGTLIIEGQTFATLSGGARHVQGGGAVAGWYFWGVGSVNGRTLADLRAEYIDRASDGT